MVTKSEGFSTPGGVPRSPDALLWCATAGAVAGALVVHPLAMALTTTPAEQTLRSLLVAVGGVFSPSMLPMGVPFALIGVGFAVLFAGVRRLCAVRRAPNAARAEAAPRRLCMCCKTMPQPGGDGSDHWLPVEQVLLHTDGIEFSHGFCPTCRNEFLPPSRSPRARSA